MGEMQGYSHTQGVLMSVPAAEAEIETANEGHLVVNDDELFVVSPVKGHVGRVLEHIVIRMTHDLDVSIARRSLGTQRLQCVLCVLGIARNGSLDLTVDGHVDLDAGFGAAFQDFIQSPFLVVIWWASQEQLRGQPPIRNVDGFLSLFKSDGNSLIGQ